MRNYPIDVSHRGFAHHGISSGITLRYPIDDFTHSSISLMYPMTDFPSNYLMVTRVTNHPLSVAVMWYRDVIGYPIIVSHCGFMFYRWNLLRKNTNLFTLITNPCTWSVSIELDPRIYCFEITNLLHKFAKNEYADLLFLTNHTDLSNFYNKFVFKK